ncbi:hypothetical protein Lal_00039668 [Lupinus albus]|nr:hypothetical protein Lal_00039668 [Lupinus albus]
MRINNHWVDEVKGVKHMVQIHFENIFFELNRNRPTFDGISFISLSSLDKGSLTCAFDDEEIKSTIWDYDISKISGPNDILNMINEGAWCEEDLAPDLGTILMKTPTSQKEERKKTFKDYRRQSFKELESKILGLRLSLVELSQTHDLSSGLLSKNREDGYWNAFPLPQPQFLLTIVERKRSTITIVYGKGIIYHPFSS